MDLTEQKWLQGFEFVPDQAQIVHHAIGYLAPAAAREQAQQLSDQDELGGWQCYGSSGIQDGDELFLGWAPGQQPTVFPAGSGIRAEPGDFIILQIHYHFDTEAPADASTILLDWADEADGDLDPIEFGEYLGPAEIPCSDDEVGPLCDRDAALAKAYERYGVRGVQADFINRACGAQPEDFELMTNGLASSSCELRVRDFGEIVSVFLHEHEIGSSIRMTLNPGRDDERILLDIPDWSFDWQLSYYPAESVVLKQGDYVLLECEWDRSRRDPDLEPSYVLWADGTNDEMCFATIATRQASTPSDSGETAGESADAASAVDELMLGLPQEILDCMSDAGVALDVAPTRETADAVADQLFECAEPSQIGAALTATLADNFGGFVTGPSIDCLADGMSTPAAVRELLVFSLDDSTEAERLPVGELVGDCVPLSGALLEFGFTLPDEAIPCIDEAGRPLLVQATIDGELPEEQTVFGILAPCLTGG